MTQSTQLHYFVAPPGVTPSDRQITSGLFEALAIFVPRGWEAMLTVTDTDARAWIRSGNERTFGKLQDTAEQAVLSLLAKLQKAAGA